MHHLFEFLEAPYWLTVALCVAAAGVAFRLAIFRPRAVLGKASTVLAVLAALAFLSGIQASEVAQSGRAQAQSDKYRQAAWAHFHKRCNENARERVNRVVENVEAIFLLRPRQKASERQLGDQFWMGDPYGYSTYEALNPPGAYLYGRSGKTISGRRFTPIRGYTYVETPNALYKESKDVPRYLRYQLKDVVVLNSVTKQPEHRIEPRGTAVGELMSRYAIAWEDISTEEDRKYWIAGGKLTIVDLQTNELIAERVGYVIDPQFGSEAHGRRPWLAVGLIPAAFCPKFETRTYRNVEFVAKALKAPTRTQDGR